MIRYGLGDLVPGETNIIAVPRKIKKRYAIIGTHGYTGTASGYNTQAAPGALTLVQKLIGSGAIFAACDFANDSWGNDAGVAAIETARTALANYGADPSKIVLFGGSMGGCLIWNYIRDHGDLVAGAALIAPLSDLNGFYANPDPTLGNPDIPQATVRTSIGTAWGVTYPQALPVKADPISNAATIAAKNVPVRIYYADSSNDRLGDADDQGNTVIPTSSLVAMQNALGSKCLMTKVSSTAQHGDGETWAALSYGIAEQLLEWAT